MYAFVKSHYKHTQALFRNWSTWHSREFNLHFHSAERYFLIIKFLFKKLIFSPTLQRFDAKSRFNCIINYTILIPLSAYVTKVLSHLLYCCLDTSSPQNRHTEAIWAPAAWHRVCSLWVDFISTVITWKRSATLCNIITGTLKFPISDPPLLPPASFPLEQTVTERCWWQTVPWGIVSAGLRRPAL